MISVAEQGNIYDIRGLSTDKDKLQLDSITNGSTFLEMDTGNVYIFDKQSGTWRQL